MWNDIPTIGLALATTASRLRIPRLDGNRTADPPLVFS
ncbi:hypothetical protein SF83666_b65950 (plasmid) [Sinorhizobium fredii CCBAU 83666]|nr:hypothetical protein SF83666_b65950 [Sinorhizobium fredii CCBAU 83666]